MGNSLTQVHCRVWLMLLWPCLFLHAQEPQTSEPKSSPESIDMSVQVQQNEQGEQTAVGGFTSTPGTTVSFDAQARYACCPAGFWKGFPGMIYTVGLWDKDPSNTVALVRFKGTIHWNNRGEIVSRTSDFAPVQVQTNKTNDKWLPVRSFQVQQKTISLIAAAPVGQLRLSNFGFSFSSKVLRIMASTSPSTGANATKKTSK